MQIVNEPNIQNVSPNTNVIQQQSQPSKTHQQQHITSTIQAPILKPSVLKDVSESRIQQIPSAFSSQALVTPSLVVSVPLSTAGVNIPPTNNTVTASLTNNPVIHQGSGLYQHLSQNTRDPPVPSTSSSSSSSSTLSVNNQRASPIVNFQQQNHHNNPVGRKSPLVQGAAMSPSIQQQQQSHAHDAPSIPSAVVGSGGSSMHSSSSVLQNINQSASSANSLQGLQTPSTANITTSESGMLKITYEKQPNSRVAQLQEDTPARRSRYVQMFVIF